MMKLTIAIILFIFSCNRELPAPPACPTCVKLWVYDTGKVDTVIKPTLFCDMPPWLTGDTGQRYQFPGGWGKVVLKCK
jgi:hypothetical protein